MASLSLKRLPRRFLPLSLLALASVSLFVGLSHHSDYSSLRIPFLSSSRTGGGISDIQSLLKYGLPPFGEESSGGKPLTALGLEADRSYRLGTTSKKIYLSQLIHFIQTAFPPSLQPPLLGGLDLYFGTSPPSTSSQYPYPPIPKNIWQTHKDYDIHIDDSWARQEGFQYNFRDDSEATQWVKSTFGADSPIWWTWDQLDHGVLRSDMYRYLILLVEGGIYSDMDTTVLKPPKIWGNNADHFGDGPFDGDVSVCIGIEADVGNREDWHDWWARPLQFMQWTIASAPAHPILLDALRRIHLTTKNLQAYASKHNKTLAQVRDELDATSKEGTYLSVMEFTGPGVWTDSVMRYLKIQFGLDWNFWKERVHPGRVRELVMLPVTGFSPGMENHLSFDTSNAEAMVYHLFAGSWKPHEEERVAGDEGMPVPVPAFPQ